MRRGQVEVGGWVRTFPDGCSGIAAVGAGVLLDVEGAGACKYSIESVFASLSLWLWNSRFLHTAASAQNVRLVVALAEA